MNVNEIKVSECMAFQDNPFQVKDDEGMELLIQSIQDYGVMTPVVVRPVTEGSYEVISGHRRLIQHDCGSLVVIGQAVMGKEDMQSNRCFEINASKGKP